MPRFIGCWMIGLFLAATASRLPAAEPPESVLLYESLIVPIQKSDQPSSCTACHFSGVSIRDYIGVNQEATFAGLRQAGLIDVQNPDESKLLQFLARQSENGSEAIEQLRKREHESFRHWIRVAVKDPTLLRAKADKPLGTELPVEVIRHARSDRVLASFVDNIWSEMGRCINCHSPERNRNKIEKFGQDYVDSISWFVPNDPAATLQRIEDDGHIDLLHPEESLLLAKPAGLVEHKGGPKFQPGDLAYRKFLSFLTDFAAIHNAEYRVAKDLPDNPADVSLLTHQHLRVTGFPAELGNVPWRIDLYVHESASDRWSGQPVGVVWGKVNVKEHLGQGMVQVVIPKSDPRLEERRHDPALPHGPWLAKIYIDRRGKLAKDPKYELGQADFVGQVEIQGDWPAGYQPPKVIKFPHRRSRD